MVNRSDNLVGMEEIGLRELPSVLSGTVKKVQEGASVLLTRYNRPAVVIVSLEDFERLRELDREATRSCPL
jgi:prevent-host-death family protein